MAWIYIEPWSPGTLTQPAVGVGAYWTTTIISSGVTAIDWFVFRKDFVARGAPTRVNTTGSVQVTVHLVDDGDFLKALDASNYDVYGDSGPVTLVTEVNYGTISIEPNSPGTLQETVAGQGARWRPVIRTTGITALDWVVISSNYSWRGQVTTQATSGTVTLDIPFLADGDFLKVLDSNNFEVYVDSVQVTILQASSTTPTPTPTPSGPFLSVTSMSSAVTVNSQNGSTASITIRRPVGAFANLLSVAVNGTTLSGTLYYSNNPGYYAVQNGNVATNRALASTDDGTRTFGILYGLSNGSVLTLQTTVLITASTTTPTPTPTPSPTPTPTPTGTRSLGIEPYSPGSLVEEGYGLGALWSPTVTTSPGMTSFTWVVVSNTFSWRSGGTTEATTGAKVINARLMATGDFVKLLDPVDSNNYYDSGSVVLQPATDLPLMAGVACRVLTSAPILTVRKSLMAAPAILVAATAALRTVTNGALPGVLAAFADGTVRATGNMQHLVKEVRPPTMLALFGDGQGEETTDTFVKHNEMVSKTQANLGNLLNYSQGIYDAVVSEAADIRKESTALASSKAPLTSPGLKGRVTVQSWIIPDAPVIIPNALDGNAQVIQLTGAWNSRILALPANLIAGTHMTIVIKQDATGSRLMTFGGDYHFQGVAPALSTIGGAVDILTCYAESPAIVYAVLSKGFMA